MKTRSLTVDLLNADIVQVALRDAPACGAATTGLGRTQRWGCRLLELFTKPEKVEGLEFVGAFGNLVIAAVLLGLTGYPASVVSVTFDPAWRVVFIGGIGLAGVASAFGYLDDHARLRRGAAFASFVCWWVWTASIWVTNLFADSPILHVLALGAALVWSWIQTRVGTNEVKKKYRH